MSNGDTATPSNTVMGHPERIFREAWISMQWKQMLRNGKGFRKPKQPTRAEQAADEARLAREREAAAKAAVEKQIGAE
ncbi:MAG TPA: hypothetical protein VFW03_13640 [Gemmatimonadaceae bacterium]|nr:hypothetical protein [Gemmatimonadaceae bacterium]